jgi:MFS family permease
MILFTLDIYLENSVTDERNTGNIRGMFLTVSNVALVISPAIVGLIVVGGQFWKIYAVSALFLIPLLVLIMRYFKPLSVISIKKTSFLKTFASFRKNKDLNNVFKTQIILQFFYAWMVIYVPVYLYEHIGFPWSKIGIIFTIMLLPFVLFELPLGKLADEKLGEKEIMTVGFIIIGLSVLFIPFLTTASFFLWAALLFLTRTGASFVEITSESYFFKHVDGNDSDKISLFRLTRPLSFVLAPLVAMLSLWLLPSFGSIFMVLGIICLFGVRYSLAIKDTK